MVKQQGMLKYLAEDADVPSLVRHFSSPLTGEVYYVDLAAGSDSQKGSTWDDAYLTINAAYDAVEADNNDYVFVTGWKTETSAAIIATLDVAQTHLIGHTGLLNPYTPEKGTLYRSAAFDGPHTNITAEFVEFAGFAVNAVQGAGTESSSVSKGALRTGTYADDGGNKAYIHNCQFPDWNDASTTTGISVTGSHYGILRDIYIENIYGNIDAGVYFTGGAGANPSLWTIENLVFRGGGGAATAVIEMSSGASNLQNSTINGLYGTRVTNMISLGTAYAAYCSINNAQGDMLEDDFFTGGSACDARDDLWTNYKWSAGANVWGRDAELAAS